MNQNKINKISTKPKPNQKPIKISAASGRYKVSTGEMSDAVNLYSREIKKFDYFIRLRKCNKRINSTPALFSFQGHLFAFSCQSKSLSFFLTIHCTSIIMVLITIFQ